eukprot:1091359_1
MAHYHLTINSIFVRQITDITDVSTISGIEHITLNKPYYTTQIVSIQGTSSTHTEYHDGHIQFHGGKSVKLPYGVDCGFIQTRISQILDNVNQSVIWTVTDLQQ